MSSRRAQVVILYEDTQQQTFIRQFLIGQGFDRTKIRLLKPPAGKGAGEQHVRKRFPRELKEYRRNRNRVQNALIVAIDADIGDVAGHVRELNESCEQNGVDPRQNDDRIMYVIPRRNIETWLAYLSGRAVNEKDTYPRLSAQRDCQRQVDRLAEMCKKGKLEANPPPSLEKACEEFKRFRRLMDQG
jgi:hypothetical protein